MCVLDTGEVTLSSARVLHGLSLLNCVSTPPRKWHLDAYLTRNDAAFFFSEKPPSHHHYYYYNY